MTNKILTSVIITVIFSLITVATFFIVLFNVENLQSIKGDLKNFNDYIVEMNLDNEDSIEKSNIESLKVHNSNVRITKIDQEGTIVYDSFDLYGEEHLDRVEIQEAMKNGEGYAVRNSDSTKKSMVYHAKYLEDGTFIRCGIVFEGVDFSGSIIMNGTIIILIIVLVFSVSFSMKLVKKIVDPINELESVTSRIASGDLHIRITANSDDEIGNLGKSFNKMAEQLKGKIKEVMEKQNRLEAILRSMESGVIAINSDDEVMVINPYAKKIFGIKGDIEGSKISDYIKDYDIINFLKEEEEEKEVKIFHPLEKELKIKKATIINAKTEIGKVIAVQDITDIKRLENMRSQFVANVSHELKTPLTSIKGFAETLKYVEDEETRKKFLDIINNESERLSRLINDILILSKIESEVLVEEEEFKPSEIIGSVLSILKNVAEEKNISLQFECINECDLYGNKDRFYQLILNIIENGIKYSKGKGFVKIKSNSDKDYYYLEVSDNGIGIPRQDISRIFERFYRVDKARKSGGTGLGLAIVKYIVKIFRGSISLESTLGKGTIFHIKLRRIK